MWEDSMRSTRGSIDPRKPTPLTSKRYAGRFQSWALPDQDLTRWSFHFEIVIRKKVRLLMWARSLGPLTALVGSTTGRPSNSNFRLGTELSGPPEPLSPKSSKTDSTT